MWGGQIPRTSRPSPKREAWYPKHKQGSAAGPVPERFKKLRLQRRSSGPRRIAKDPLAIFGAVVLGIVCLIMGFFILSLVSAAI